MVRAVRIWNSMTTALCVFGVGAVMTHLPELYCFNTAEGWPKQCGEAADPDNVLFVPMTLTVLSITAATLITAALPAYMWLKKVPFGSVS